MYKDLFDNLKPGDIVLTANQRLADFLRTKHAHYQQTKHKQTWLSPDILPFTTWLERCWEDYQITGLVPPMVLLNSAQEHLIWEEIISNSPQGNNLLHTTATAQMAQQAWQLCKQWKIDYHTTDFTQNEDTAAWQAWAKQFQTLSQRQNWLDSHSLPDQMSQFAVKNRLHHCLYLIGFDEFNPQQEHLFNVLSKQGYHFKAFHYQSPTPQIRSLSLADSTTELRTMARWAYSHWKQGAQSIGCIIPNLSKIRADVTAIFTEIFSPEATLVGYQDTPLPFNISAGIKLKDFPLIHTALLILGLNQEIELTTLGSLLRSPYLGYAEKEMNLRAQLDAHLRSLGESSIPLNRALEEAKKKGVLQFANQLQTYLKTYQSSKSQMPMPAWATLFSQQLTAFGWPGERELNSKEFQLIESWLNLLSNFAGLGLVSDSMLRTKAIQILNNLAATQEFQPKTERQPIQILGILEAGGLTFQHLWVAGLHDAAWPPPANPNPFIPFKLQRALKLPHASSERELYYCNLLTKRFFYNAPNIILSFPECEEDRRFYPSPLIRTIQTTEEDALDLTDYKSYAEVIFESANIEFIKNEMGPSLTIQEKILGGSAIFKHQAACPFRAFAKMRLGAHALEHPQTGLTLKERGSLLHHALEITWQLIRNQENLLSYSNSELQAIIQQAVQTSLENFMKKRPLTFKKRFTQIEKTRLSRLIQDWLEIEKKRPPFTVIATEHTEIYQFADIPLTLRIDRIDKLSDESYIIIDYKTGRPTITDWFGERLEEPQLPLYCTSSKLAINGLLFAQIRSDNKQFKGISASDNNIAGVYPIGQLNDRDLPQNWYELLNHWRKVLQNLGQQFQEGYALVDPKDNAQTCQFCDLQVLCRVSESLFINEKLR